MGAPEAFLDGRVTLYAGDCLAVLADLPAESVDAVVTDPPYHLQSIVDRFGATSPEDDNATGARARAGSDGLARAFRGFMGLQWDGGQIAFEADTWRAVARVLKPGAYLIAFGGTRTYHRMACAIEDAGFDVRDMLQWLFSVGFPKRPDMLKPACEPVCLARKPFPESLAENVARYGTGALNIDGCRVGDDVLPAQRAGQARLGTFERTDMVTSERLGRWPANVVHDGEALPPEVGRYFYSAKADSDDRLGSNHPTVKPVDLMRWLVRLVTPAGGVVLDPFAGTGTTGEAAYREGARAVLVEREAAYLADIRRRLALVHAGPLARSAAKALRRPEAGHGPLFDGLGDDR